MISILLAAYKSEELLKKVFFAGLQNCLVDCEVIVFDNGGNNLEERGLDIDFSFTTKEGVNIDWVKIGDGKNVGLNVALNECAKVAKGDWFYLPHTDMYLMPGWDIALLNAAKNHLPNKLLLCSRSIEPTKGHTDYHIVKNYGMEWDKFDEKSLLDDFRDYQSSDIITGSRMPFFLHRTLWNKMGGVDPNYFSYCTDDDLVQEAYDKKVRCFWMVFDSLVYHLQGKSNQQQSIDRDSLKPYEYFVDKWKKRGYPNAQHPAHWHPRLIPWYNKVR